MLVWLGIFWLFSVIRISGIKNIFWTNLSCRASYRFAGCTRRTSYTFVRLLHSWKNYKFGTEIFSRLTHRPYAVVLDVSDFGLLFCISEGLASLSGSVHPDGAVQWGGADGVWRHEHAVSRPHVTGNTKPEVAVVGHLHDAVGTHDAQLHHWYCSVVQVETNCTSLWQFKRYSAWK